MDGSRKFTKVGTHDQGEQELSRMSTGLTGARSGDVLLGTHKGTESALLQVYNDIPPSRKILDRIRPYPDLWTKFLIKLGGIPFLQIRL